MRGQGRSGRARIRLAVAGALGAVLAAAMLGFVLFANAALRQEQVARGRADGIVVLTGEASRIAAGARLLAEGRAGRLLISGVNRRIGREEVRRLTGLSPADFERCVDIGYDALDTKGNAVEADAWAAAHRFSRLIIVTSSYHMPRALTEMGRRLPGATLVPHAVPMRRLAGEPWWLRLASARLLVEEYLKFLPSAARYAVGRLVRPGEARAAGPAAP